MDVIFYTKTDEAPALATYSLFPIIKAFLSLANISIQLKDISLAGRILACFPHASNGQVSDDLKELATKIKQPTANIIKLPNISASIPQLKGAIKELQAQGFDLPYFPDEPKTDKEKNIYKKYAKILGSAVNPVLREGNSDRRVVPAVKEYAKEHPHKMGEWASDSLTHVASMTQGDFYGSEKALILPQNISLDICFYNSKERTYTSLISQPKNFAKGDIIDSAMMSKEALCQFFEAEIKDAKQKDVLFSLHLKATMMKISDPIIFARAIRVYFKEAFKKYDQRLDDLGVNLRHGLQALFNKVQSSDDRENIIKAFEECYIQRPRLAMVDSAKGISNFHIPSDVIIDSSMPSAIRSSGKMWGPDGKLHPIKAVIPDRSYAGIYQKVIDFCKKHGAFDPRTMGSVSNIGLMAKKAQEYGSHDKTFEIVDEGKICVMSSDNVLLEHPVTKGDIWRMCHTTDEAIRDWVKLAVERARITGHPTIFWLDPQRAHDRCVIQKVKMYLQDHDTKDLDINILSPVEAMQKTLERIQSGKDIIAVTGNVLRDYLTDLFPILEVGTSAKMLSIVPLLAGGGLYETGAGGTAPRHVDQFLKENHLRWSSLGEFLALAVSLEDLSCKSSDEEVRARVAILASALNQANEKFLKEGRSPSRKVYELDSRGSHFYWCLYWAEALVTALEHKIQQDDITEAEKSQWNKWKEQCELLADQLQSNEKKILKELNQMQGKAVDIGGYYHPDKDLASQVMRPSTTFNHIIDTLFHLQC